MKPKLWLVSGLLLTLGASFLVVSGCAHPASTMDVPAYRRILAETDPAKRAPNFKGSPAEEKGLKNFRNFMETMTVEKVKADTRLVYAPDAHLNDTLKALQGVEAIEAYFLKTAANCDETKVEFLDVAESKGDYYYRWIMTIRLKGDKPEEAFVSKGMSQVRFDSEGRVILQQDFWDSSGAIYEHVPVLGWGIRQVRSRF